MSHWAAAQIHGSAAHTQTHTNAHKHKHAEMRIIAALASLYHTLLTFDEQCRQFLFEPEERNKLSAETAAQIFDTAALVHMKQ